MAKAGKQPEIMILLLSSDQEFLGQVTDAVEERYVLFHAKDLKQALGFDHLNQIALLIADSELLSGEPAPMLERLSRRAPGMVQVVAGTANDRPRLKQLMNDGKIFRVLTKPCQPGQTRLYIEAAIKQAMQARLRPQRGKIVRALLEKTRIDRRQCGSRTRIGRIRHSLGWR